MFLGIGTDIVEVARFKSWQNYSKTKLLRVFSEQELNYCLCKSDQDSCSYNLQCLASRFAAKEAFFKALSATLVKLNLTHQEFPFLFACQNVEIVKTVWDVPELNVNWKAFEKKVGERLADLEVKLSISHEKAYVVSFVVIQKG